ncbi:MAG TPA: hypothetical protein VFM65_08620 [Flavobacteriaceae bacterium]|nr:hypothetical protein [Flavobacteriaceae bacterium]
MKKYFFALMLLAIGFSSCQDEPKKQPVKSEKATEKTDSLKVLRGEFIYVDSAAVLKGNDFIYGVEIDSMAKKLARKTDSLKRNEFDMVPVILEGVVRQNKKEEGWDEILTIKEILRVSEPVSDPAIRIESE